MRLTFTSSLIAITTVLSAPFATALELDGFKNIKFGMSRSEAEMVGFVDCTSETYSCSWHRPDITVLGQKTDYISVNFDESGLDEIRVQYPKPPVDEIKDLTKAFGKPSKYTYQSLNGNHIVGHAWLTESQSSALTITYPSGEETGRIRRSVFGGGMVMDKTSTISFVAGANVKRVSKYIAESNAPVDAADI